MMIIRLMSYNVRSLRDDARAVARVIRSAAPDVVCVQEAPRFFRWRSKCAELARRSGLVIVCGGRPAAANLILSTLAVDVRATRSVKFSKDPRLHHRGCAMAVLAKSGRPFAVVGTHLDLKPEPRLRHIGELRRHADGFRPSEVPLIVAGDINEQPGEPAWRALTEIGTDAFAAVGVDEAKSFSVTNPNRRIDGIFAAAPLKVLSAEVLDSPDVRVASDHRPLVVEVELAE
jgi:endonuclease/exonuclease/phosphatase family metal-dependent hydrolase